MELRVFGLRLDFISKTQLESNNSSVELFRDDPLTPTISTILLVIISTFLIIWVILTNSLLLVGILKKNGKKNSTDCYLLNLCVIDLCVGVIVLPLMTAVVLIGYFPLSLSFCTAWIYWDYFLIVASSYGYTALFLNHLKMIRNPGKFRESLQPHILIVVFLWLAANLSWGPSFLHNMATEKNQRICGYQIHGNKYYTLYVAVSGFYIPLLLSIFCVVYGWIILRQKSHNRLFYNTGSQFISSNGTVNTKQRNWSLAVIMETNHILITQNQARNEQPLLLTLLLAFILSRILFYIYFGVGGFVGKFFPPDMSDGVYWVMHSNAALCPVIHFYLDEEVRDTTRTFLRCPRQKKSFPSAISLTVSTCSELRTDSAQFDY